MGLNIAGVVYSSGQYSAAGTRIRVARVRAEPPNQPDRSGLCKMCHKVSDQTTNPRTCSASRRFLHPRSPDCLPTCPDTETEIDAIRPPAVRLERQASRPGSASPCGRAVVLDGGALENHDLGAKVPALRGQGGSPVEKFWGRGSVCLLRRPPAI